MATTNQASINVTDHIYTNDTPVVFLDATKSFANLSADERLYAHYLSKASWYGSLIGYFQTSPESPLIWSLFGRLFAGQKSLDELKNVAVEKAEFSEEEWKSFLIYSAAFYGNFGNYRGYGDSKFIPDLPASKFEALIKSSAAWTADPIWMDYVWGRVGRAIFSLEKNELSLGFRPNGTTTYWSKGMTEEDSKVVKAFLEANNIDAYNTRALKDPTTGEYIIRFASVLDTASAEDREYLDKINQNIANSNQSDSTGTKFRLERGDYSPILRILNRYLLLAKSKAQNSNQISMLEHYIRHFNSGCLEAHKEGSRYWIKDKGPAVETYIGFIENYRDPAGQRAEFEGFVTMVDREISKKFTDLVNHAPMLLAKLPWPKEFEKDRFLQPDFTSLDVLTFCSSGIPIGINIPNYEEIRQNEGFKNVNLGNVISTLFKNRKRNFIRPEDDAFLEQYAIPSTEIITGLHELLGHGSGKLLKATGEDGQVNFDREKTVNPLTGKKVEMWYDSKETYDSKFGSLSSAYEECRAEGIAHYLCFEPKVLEIFGFTAPTEIGNLIYATYYELVLAGIESLKMFSPRTGKWLQAHSQANFVLLRVLLEGEECRKLIKIEVVEKADDGKPDLHVTFTRDPIQIRAKCRKALGEFLLQLQIAKSLGDVSLAKDLFERYSTVANEALPWLRIREIAVARKKPRRLMVQASSKIEEDGGGVVLKSYEESAEGLISSILDHFSEKLEEEDVPVEKMVVELWKKDEANWW